jgi:hypothetical protein
LNIRNLVSQQRPTYGRFVRRLFSNSWSCVNGNIPLVVPAGFTVLFAVVMLRIMAFKDVGGSMCETRLPIGVAKPPTISPSPSSRLGHGIRACGFSLFLCVGLRIAPLEIGSIAPHAMHDDCEFSCHSDLGLLETDTFRQSDTPSFDWAPFRDACQQNTGCLEQLSKEP